MLDDLRAMQEEKLNLDFLGDALDHGKGPLFGDLQENHLLPDLAAEQMARDSGLWYAQDISFLIRIQALRQVG